MEKVKEQIKVMQHFANGGEIEFSQGSGWHNILEPQWNWSDYDYRIKEQKKIIITIEKWLMQGDMGCYFVLEGSINYFENLINITKVKLIDTYEVEL